MMMEEKDIKFIGFMLGVLFTTGVIFIGILISQLLKP